MTPRSARVQLARSERRAGPAPRGAGGEVIPDNGGGRLGRSPAPLYVLFRAPHDGQTNRSPRQLPSMRCPLIVGRRQPAFDLQRRAAETCCRRPQFLRRAQCAQASSIVGLWAYQVGLGRKGRRQMVGSLLCIPQVAH
eukprot:scaffold2391_cov124-Isochrysis_galbana.AAC.2